MAKKVFEIFDSFELKIPAKRSCKQLIDSLEDTKSLIVKVKATHGGYINGNMYNYSVDSMKSATKSWIKPFKKPVLTHHDDLSDPIGRVIDSEFVLVDTNRRNKPKGYVELTLKITNQDAIEKILDGRYMTVSVGSRPNSCICSICDRNLVEDGPCDHIRGKKYDSGTCHWDINLKEYTEVSFVNKPADEYQHGIESTEIGDTEEDDFNFTIDINKAEFYLEDSENNDESEKVDKLKIDNVDGTWTEDDLHLINWLLDEFKKENLDTKLSTEQRKKLSSNVFCGPNKSFPVNDCAHYTAAKRLIGKYKGPGDKTRILACIERKGKKLGCSSKKSKDSNGDLIMDEIKKLEDQIKSFEEQISTLKKEKDTASQEKTDIENQLADKSKEIETLNNKVIKYEAEKHEISVNKYFDLRVELGKQEVKDLKDDEILAYKEKLSKRTSDSLEDSIKDLESEKVEIKETKEPTEKINKDSVDNKKETQTVVEDKVNATKTETRDLGDAIE